ncbi:MAG: bifunctional N(6)-L-threonylcarbamoyladenine synthase/serine/threonine protein kinase [Thermoplasmata archaeon]|nr:MAG: bifunctional N(6)-L-threonylcarbamoyladenine synthase/serine/threonine protein kinase [Thermoplasmata archaeon]
MIVLGLEGTAHTAGVGIVDGEKVLVNISDMYMPVKGGIHPREAANHHAEVFPGLIKRALERAGIGVEDLDGIAFSQGPGLGPCLRTVATVARVLALRLSIPLIGVNHCVAHLEIGRLLTGASDPVLLYVSGGNTQIIAYANGRYRVCGETQDIGIGNMFDKFGREIGLPFPCGPEVERLAKKGKKLLMLPYSVKGMDVAFSGILTAAQSYIGKERIEDIAYSLQEIAFSMLVEVSERALAHLEKDEILLGGGVAQNKRLQEMVRNMITERDGNMYVPPPQYCVDNGAMIAYTGYLMLSSGQTTSVENSVVRQRYRTDEVVVSWRKS